ncbi:uncharacterized protein DNG_00664 [Cephalotrichum gorgonifer]|uniref:DUF7053 domain-containing protein n=1 Tax=Cephalotrichum gorgonifer TaxID=2041049 RepID=A0AAE8SRF1_9PEZI|nr:uncharacterized protein DNG_00664 [Cephalotrichum gorgonifer]
MTSGSTTSAEGGSGSGSAGSMRKRHSLTLRTSISRHLPPHEVVAALQTYSPVIKHQPLVTRFERAPTPPDCTADPFFHAPSEAQARWGDDGSGSGSGSGSSSGVRGGGRPPRAPHFVTFEIYERISLIPGIASKEIHFLSTFRDVPGGIRCRADAPGGVTLWIEYRVCARPPPESEDAALSTTSPSATASPWPAVDWEAEVDRRREYDLVEWVTVETNSMLMPFVARTMEAAHREICQKVLDEVAVRFSW